MARDRAECAYNVKQRLLAISRGTFMPYIKPERPRAAQADYAI